MVGLCTDIHARNGSNMPYIYCEILIPFVFICLLCVYSSNLLCCGVNYSLTRNSGICVEMVRGSKTMVETK